MIEKVVRLLDARRASNIARDSCSAQHIGEDIAYVAEAEGAENSLYIGEGLSNAIRSRNSQADDLACCRIVLLEYAGQC